MWRWTWDKNEIRIWFSLRSMLGGIEKKAHLFSSLYEVARMWQNNSFLLADYFWWRGTLEIQHIGLLVLWLFFFFVSYKKKLKTNQSRTVTCQWSSRTVQELHQTRLLHKKSKGWYLVFCGPTPLKNPLKTRVKGAMRTWLTRSF